MVLKRGQRYWIDYESKEDPDASYRGFGVFKGQQNHSGLEMLYFFELDECCSGDFPLNCISETLDLFAPC